LEKPTALPAAKAPLDQSQTKAWIQSLEDQVGELKSELRKEVDGHKACRPKA